MLARLQYHGSTGPPPSYLWPNLTQWHGAVERLCDRSEESGFAEPLDWGGVLQAVSSVDGGASGRRREVWRDAWLEGTPW